MATAKTKVVRLNKNARAWVKALRSGKHKQTKHTLSRVDPNTGEITGQCCMGVLCELALKSGVHVKSDVRVGHVYYNGLNQIPPTVIMEWAGLKTVIGEFGDSCLTAKNDSGKSFKQIARIIEQNAKELFV